MAMIMTGVAKHRRQCRVFEPARKMLGLDEEAEGAFGSEGYLPHGLPSKVATRNMRATVYLHSEGFFPGAADDPRKARAVVFAGEASGVGRRREGI